MQKHLLKPPRLLHLILPTLTIISLLSFTYQDSLPDCWRLMGSSSDKYVVGIDKNERKTGSASAFIKSHAEKIKGFGALEQSISADAYLGKRIKLTGFLKTLNVENKAGLWLRVDQRFSNDHLGFDNMNDRPITGTTDWKSYAIEMDIPHNSSTINYGALLSGTGTIWVDDIAIEVISDLKTEKKENTPLSGPTNTNFEN